MVIFAAIQGLLNILAVRRRINIIEQIQTSYDIIVFPKCLFCLVGAIIGSEFSSDNVLGRCLICQRQNNARDIFPFLNDQFSIDFPNWFYPTITIPAGMFETIKRFGNGIVNVFETGRKLVVEQMKQGKIDLICSV